MRRKSGKDIGESFAEGTLIDEAMRRGVREAIRQHLLAGVPMVVWRRHGVTPPAEDLAHMLTCLKKVAAERVGEYWVDDHMRNIPDHFHAHARPRGGFFGR